MGAFSWRVCSVVVSPLCLGTAAAGSAAYCCFWKET